MDRPPNRQGQKPGKVGKDLRGILVRWPADVAQIGGFGYGKATGSKAPPGWYLWVRVRRGAREVWEAILFLRFGSLIDATRARDALVTAGLDSAKRMKAAGPELIMLTAFEALRW